VAGILEARFLTVLFPRIDMDLFVGVQGRLKRKGVHPVVDRFLPSSSHSSTMATTTMTKTAIHPPFPDDVPTAPLLRLSLHRLLKRDEAEVERFNRACEDLGFFYLDLEGDGDSLFRDADGLFNVAEALCDLPLEEKEKYDFSSKKTYFGYKAQGAAVADRNGNLDRNEFYNVIQLDDAFGCSK
jgi:hypothetical protein